MFEEAAQFWGVPVAWTQAIADVESGTHPWSLNIEGKGHKFISKEMALAMARQAKAQGRSFDSGIMQVNNFWLKKYGIPLEAAFDPLANIYLGSWILKQEIGHHGQTWEAIGAYHSPNENKGRRYAEMVKGALAKGRAPKATEPGTLSSFTDRKPKGISKSVVDEKERGQAPLIVSRSNSKLQSSSWQGGRADPFVKRIPKKIF
ncbi:lytic transglycosylase domain-containing protein [Desulfobulbus rhabdoformis]|uniref:lytic transglycosylase domain-containing protein n=1 Tax=Desulfobulbus rhabdoformis TaxID=34032 RepID=UPI0019663927|nr:lytic transglycosylase domain-containing protein [Desulfobulbus rhabdoformis]MBM9614865.1 lytic transglycosylase domain-containing protein [Desulfobulbus rhabdoformis]